MSPTPVWRLFPPAKWLRVYRSAWLASDAIAGVTLAACSCRPSSAAVESGW